MNRRRFALRRWLRWLLTAAVAAFAGRTAWLAAAWFAGIPGVRRFHLETSATWLVALGLLLAAVQPPADADPGDARTRPAAPPLWACGLWCVAAVALFLPALSIGLLSDDFVLAARARGLHFGAFNAMAFRPFPLMLWSVLLNAGLGPAALHLLNLVLHGVAGYLTWLVAARFVRRPWAIAAGAMVLAFPLAPEAVVWCSGVFDVSATCLVLAAVLVARGYDAPASRARRAALFAVAALSLLSKETALALPGLILLDAAARASWPRRLLADVGVLAGAAVLVASLRLAVAPPAIRQPVTRYLLQRWLFGTLGNLVVPLRADLIAARPLLPAAAAVTAVGLVAAFFLVRQPAASRRAAAAYGAFALAATVPTITILFVAPDLQQSRYLYPATPGYAVALVILAASVAGRGRILRTAAATAVGVLMAIDLFALHLQQQPWIEAAAVRDAVTRAFTADARIQACATVHLSDLPDNHRGAYVFRNGAAEALAGPHVVFDAASAAPAGSCSFAWDAAAGGFRPAAR